MESSETEINMLGDMRRSKLKEGRYGRAGFFPGDSESHIVIEHSMEEFEDMTARGEIVMLFWGRINWVAWSRKR